MSELQESLILSTEGSEVGSFDQQGPRTAINQNAKQQGAARAAQMREAFARWQLKQEHGGRPSSPPGSSWSKTWLKASHAQSPAAQDSSSAFYDLEAAARNASSDSLAGEETESVVQQPCRADEVSVFQACFNLCNLFIGIGLLSTAYAFRLGGWAAVIALLAITLCFGAAGLLQLKCLDLMPMESRTYHSVGAAACGTAGRALVSVVTTVEYTGYAVMQTILFVHQIEAVTPDVRLLGLQHHHLAVLAAALLVSPVLLVGNFRHVSILSALGISCTSVLFFSVLGTAICDPTRSHLRVQPLPGHTLLGPGWPEAAGIFAVGLSGPSGSALPTLRASMKQPHKFKQVLWASLGVMLLIYGLVGSVGYFYFGEAATQLITADLQDMSQLGQLKLLGHIRFDKMISAIIGVHAFTVLGPQILVLQDMLLGVCPQGDGSRRFLPPVWAVAMRFLIFGLVLLVAVVTFSMLGSFESILGAACSISSSMLLPALFFYRLHRHEFSRRRQLAVALLFGVGIALAVTILHHNVITLYRRRHPRPGLSLL